MADDVQELLDNLDEYIQQVRQIYAVNSSDLSQEQADNWTSGEKGDNSCTVQNRDVGIISLPVVSPLPSQVPYSTESDIQRQSKDLEINSSDWGHQGFSSSCGISNYCPPLDSQGVWFDSGAQGVTTHSGVQSLATHSDKTTSFSFTEMKDISNQTNENQEDLGIGRRIDELVFNLLKNSPKKRSFGTKRSKNANSSNAQEIERETEWNLQMKNRKCSSCNIIFASENKYMSHVSETHQSKLSQNSKWKCNLCNILFESEKTYKCHVSSSHSRKLPAPRRHLKNRNSSNILRAYNATLSNNIRKLDKNEMHVASSERISQSNLHCPEKQLADTVIQESLHCPENPTVDRVTKQSSQCVEEQKTDRMIEESQDIDKDIHNKTKTLRQECLYTEKVHKNCEENQTVVKLKGDNCRKICTNTSVVIEWGDNCRYTKTNKSSPCTLNIETKGFSPASTDTNKMTLKGSISSDTDCLGEEANIHTYKDIQNPESHYHLKHKGGPPSLCNLQDVEHRNASSEKIESKTINECGDTYQENKNTCYHSDSSVNNYSYVELESFIQPDSTDSDENCSRENLVDQSLDCSMENSMDQSVADADEFSKNDLCTRTMSFEGHMNLIYSNGSKVRCVQEKLQRLYKNMSDFFSSDEFQLADDGIQCNDNGRTAPDNMEELLKQSENVNVDKTMVSDRNQSDLHSRTLFGGNKMDYKCSTSGSVSDINLICDEEDEEEEEETINVNLIKYSCRADLVNCNIETRNESLDSVHNRFISKPEEDLVWHTTTQTQQEVTESETKEEKHTTENSNENKEGEYFSKWNGDVVQNCNVGNWQQGKYMISGYNKSDSIMGIKSIDLENEPMGKTISELNSNPQYSKESMCNENVLSSKRRSHNVENEKSFKKQESTEHHLSKQTFYPALDSSCTAHGNSQVIEMDTVQDTNNLCDTVSVIGPTKVKDSVNVCSTDNVLDTDILLDTDVVRGTDSGCARTSCYHVHMLACKGINPEANHTFLSFRSSGGCSRYQVRCETGNDSEIDNDKGCDNVNIRFPHTECENFRDSVVSDTDRKRGRDSVVSSTVNTTGNIEGKYDGSVTNRVEERDNVRVRDKIEGRDSVSMTDGVEGRENVSVTDGTDGTYGLVSLTDRVERRNNVCETGRREESKLLKVISRAPVNDNNSELVNNSTIARTEDNQSTKLKRKHVTLKNVTTFMSPPKKRWRELDRQEDFLTSPGIGMPKLQCLEVYKHEAESKISPVNCVQLSDSNCGRSTVNCDEIKDVDCGEIKHVDCGAIKHVDNGTVAHINSSEIKHVDCGAIKSVDNGTVAHINSSEIKHVDCGAIKSVDNGTVAHINSSEIKHVDCGAIKSVDNGTVTHINSSEIKHVDCGAIKSVDNGTVAHISSSEIKHVDSNDSITSSSSEDNSFINTCDIERTSYIVEVNDDMRTTNGYVLLDDVSCCARLLPYCDIAVMLNRNKT